MQLDQNAYRPDSRGAAALGGEHRPDQVTQGYLIDSVQVEHDAAAAPTAYLVSDTRMQVRLDRPLKAKGGLLRLHIAYHYVVPGLFGGRTAWVDTRNGPIFDVAQWYPRMCVFDDVQGWDTLPYLAQGSIWSTATSTTPSPRPPTQITVETRDKLVAPTSLDVRYTDEASKRVALPVETWQLGGKATLTLGGGPAIASVTIDPDHRLPDRDRSTNTFTPAPPSATR